MLPRKKIGAIFQSNMIWITSLLKPHPPPLYLTRFTRLVASSSLEKKSFFRKSVLNFIVNLIGIKATMKSSSYPHTRTPIQSLWLIFITQTTILQSELLCSLNITAKFATSHWEKKFNSETMNQTSISVFWVVYLSVTKYYKHYDSFDHSLLLWIFHFSFIWDYKKYNWNIFISTFLSVKFRSHTRCYPIFWVC